MFIPNFIAYFDKKKKNYLSILFVYSILYSSDIQFNLYSIEID